MGKVFLNWWIQDFPNWNKSIFWKYGRITFFSLITLWNMKVVTSWFGVVFEYEACMLNSYKLNKKWIRKFITVSCNSIWYSKHYRGLNFQQHNDTKPTSKLRLNYLWKQRKSKSFSKLWYLPAIAFSQSCSEILGWNGQKSLCDDAKK